MTDTLARMRQIIGSPSEWAANDIILGYGELGIERVSVNEYKIKCGDSMNRWSVLPYISMSSTTINAAVQAALDAKLALAGGTMKGSLILAHDGTASNEAVTVSQLNSEVTKLNNADAGKLPIAGGTMTGGLFLAHAAAFPLEAVTFDQMNKAVQGMIVSAPGGLTFAGTTDPTITYAAPVPAPVNGGYYTVTTAGAVDPSWSTHLSNPGLASVAIGDYLVWNATTNKFHHISNPASLIGYVPLAGTSAMAGNIVWSGAANSKKGTAIISGKGGTLDEIVIDDGIF